jgi:HEPN domain-containing protein
MDSVRQLEAQQWLVKAQQDLKVACLLYDTGEVVLSAVVCHCQQSAEKALKAYVMEPDRQESQEAITLAETAVQLVMSLLY